MQSDPLWQQCSQRQLANQSLINQHHIIQSQTFRCAFTCCSILFPEHCLLTWGYPSWLFVGVCFLFVGPLLDVGIRCSRFLLRRRSQHGVSDDARLPIDEPEVSRPQDQVNETKCLRWETVKVNPGVSVQMQIQNFINTEQKNRIEKPFIVIVQAQ